MSITFRWPQVLVFLAPVVLFWVTINDTAGLACLLGEVLGAHLTLYAGARNK